MSLILKEYLNEEEIEHIKTHKYKTTGYSWLDNKINPFWEWAAGLLPYQITPNKVTLMGAFSLYFGTIVLAFYDLTFSEKLPNWMYVMFVVCIFLGQTFDAIDGKHARNTQRFSPLGQLMDHGCDAITNSCITIFLAQSFYLGYSITSLVILQAFVHMAFYVGTWEENKTGIICTHVNNIGVTELQITAMILCICPILPDVALFLTKHLFLKFSIIDIFVYLNCFGLSLIVMVLTFIRVFKTLDKSQYLKSTYPLLNLIIIVVGELLASQLKCYNKYALLFVLLNGFYFGLSASKMIITTMSGCPQQIPSRESLVYLASIIVGLVFPSLEIIVLVFLFSFIFLYYIRYYGSIIIQLLSALKITTF